MKPPEFIAMHKAYAELLGWLSRAVLPLPRGYASSLR
jgi:hypothetical protein